MKPTEEQQIIIDAVMKENKDNKPLNPIVKVNSVAGSGKTSLLVEIATKLNKSNSLYLAYSKAIAVEATEKFKNKAVCKTTHSMAWQNIMRPLKAEVSKELDIRHIKAKVDIQEKIALKMLIDEFCLSKYTSVKDFMSKKNDKYEDWVTDSIIEILKNMESKKIPFTHSSYFKLFHIYIANGSIKFPEFDLIMLDEAGDLNPVTLEIFMMLPAKRKILVGDHRQNIFGFNNTINGFEELKGVGLELSMTKSFRVGEGIAKDVEAFMQKHVQKSFSFKGIPLTGKETVKTTMYLTRNNSFLIGHIVKLMRTGEKFNLARKTRDIFELPLVLMALKPGCKQVNKDFNKIQKFTDDYVVDHPDATMSMVRSRLEQHFSDDSSISSALSILRQNDFSDIYSAHKYAKSMEMSRTKFDYTLATCHSIKGMEADRVIIGEDLEKSISKIIDKENNKPKGYYDEDELSELSLYYVAVSRAKIILTGAKALYM